MRLRTRVAWLRGAAVRHRLAELYTERIDTKAQRKQLLGELEDTLFKLAEQGAGTIRCLQADCTAHGVCTVYGTTTKRLVEFYAQPGIFKLKANWGQDVLLKVQL